MTINGFERENRRQRRIAEYEAKAAQWLGNANEQAEQGNKMRAQRMYDRSEYWLSKANVLRGNGDGRNP